jgi:hypothetical protein
MRMRKTLLLLAIFATASSASALTVVVDSHVGPWDPVVNNSFSFGAGGGALGPVVIDGSSGISFAAGSQITVSWLSGLAGACCGRSSDANGHVGFQSFKNAN